MQGAPPAAAPAVPALASAAPAPAPAAPAPAAPVLTLSPDFRLWTTKKAWQLC